MLGGSVAIEQAFGVPGLSLTLVTAVIERHIISGAKSGLSLRYHFHPHQCHGGFEL